MTRQGPISFKCFSDFLTNQTIAFCDHLHLKGWNPKSFLSVLLLSKNSNLAVRRRLWASDSGWPSTLRILKAVKLQAYRSKAGVSKWEAFVLEEVGGELSNNK